MDELFSSILMSEGGVLPKFGGGVGGDVPGVEEGLVAEVFVGARASNLVPH